MRIIFAIGLLLCVHNALYAQANSGSNKGIICWCENRKLVWRDFQATSSQLEKNDSLFDTDAANAAPILTAKGIVDEDGKNNFIVVAAFDSKRAWVRDSTTLLAAEILKHEQGHFDICELVARKLRLRIRQAYKKGRDVFDPSFRDEMQRSMGEHDTLQDTYDRETAHGSIVAQQQRWNERIKRELISLVAYKSTARDCSVNY